jgi:hypothetical protein
MRFQLALVFIVVTVHAQQLPVTAIRWVVVVIMIAMVHGQFVQIFTVEFSCATATDMRIQLECLFAITQLTLLTSASGTGHDLIQLVIFWFSHSDLSICTRAGA